LLVIFAPLPGVARLLLVAETLCMTLFSLWLLRNSERRSDTPPWAREPVWRAVRLGCWLAVIVASAALASNVGGYVRLADLMVRTALGSAYTAVWLYALTRVGESAAHGLMYVPPVSLLGMVQRHRMLLSNRFNRWLRAGAFLAWIALTLQVPGLLQPVLTFFGVIWNASTTLGAFTISVESLAYFFLAIWLAFIVSRLLRFVLEEEVYPHLNLERGLPYAVSTLLHYVLLVTGVLIGLGVLGVDMTRFTIVAGAFSVGIGFGLQNIVNNFVSGLIVLFERPIKVGDTIQIDDVIGRVQHIGIRASVVRSTAGSEVIIPNAKLIADKVTNWTLSSQLRQIAVPLLTKPDIDVPEFKQVLLDIAGRNPRVTQTPAPEVLFIRRALDNFEFELRVWTQEVDAWLEVKSDLITEINETLRQSEMAAQAQAAPAGPNLSTTDKLAGPARPVAPETPATPAAPVTPAASATPSAQGTSGQGTSGQGASEHGIPEQAKPRAQRDRDLTR
jgi:small-conductance mechanosensitive channel